MNDRRSATRVLAALALAIGFAACSGGGDRDDDAVTVPAGQPGVFRSIALWAGTMDQGGPGVQDGVGSAARFWSPEAVAAASDGSLWVTQGVGVRRIDGAGAVTTVPDSEYQPPISVDASGATVMFIPRSALTAGRAATVFMAMTRRSVSAAGELEDRWSVWRLAPGLPPVMVALPGESTGAGSSATALALDRDGRLLIADRRCAIWRTDGDVTTTATARGAVLVHGSDPANPNRPCGADSPLYGVVALAIDGHENVLFTLANGDVRRIGSDGQVAVLGKVADTDAGCTSMAVDPSGRVLLSGVGSTRALMQLTSSGPALAVAGSEVEAGVVDGHAANARFARLCGLAVDREGRIVLTDTTSNTVRRVAVDGTVSTVAGRAYDASQRDGVGAEARFGSSMLVGPDTGRAVVVADFNTARLVDAEQRVRTLVPAADAGLPDSNRLSIVVAALRTPDGSLWIGDDIGLRLVGTDGVLRTLVARGVSTQQVRSLALGRTGDVIVGWGTAPAYRTDPNPTLRFERHSAAAPQAAPQRLDVNVPADLAARLGSATLMSVCELPDGTLAYSQGHAVLRRATDGTVSVLAGSPNEHGSNDGPAATARFDEPKGLACDAAGGIYVADSRNATVRYIDVQRNVRTSLGTAGKPGLGLDVVPGQSLTPKSLVLVPDGLIVQVGAALVRATF